MLSVSSVAAPPCWRTSGEWESDWGDKHFTYATISTRAMEAIYSAGGLWSTCSFSALPDMMEKLALAAEFIAALNENQMQRLGRATGQAAEGALSNVSRDGVLRLKDGFQWLATHPLRGAFHATAFTETVNETFFSAVTLCLGAARMTSLSQLEWGTAMIRASVRWMQGLVGVKNAYELGHRERHHYAHLRHVPPLWFVGEESLEPPRRRPRTAAENVKLEERRVLVVEACRRVVRLRTLRVRSMCAWRSGSGIAAEYHDFRPRAEVSSTHTIVAGDGPATGARRAAANEFDEDENEEDEGDGAAESDGVDDPEVAAGDCWVREEELQVNDDIAVLAEARAEDGPFWLGRLVSLGEDYVKVKWYERCEEEERVYEEYAGGANDVAVSSILGRALLQPSGSSYTLSEEEFLRWTEAANLSRRAMRRPPADRGGAADVRRQEKRARDMEGKTYQKPRTRTRGGDGGERHRISSHDKRAVRCESEALSWSRRRDGGGPE